MQLLVGCRCRKVLWWFGVSGGRLGLQGRLEVILQPGEGDPRVARLRRAKGLRSFNVNLCARDSIFAII